MIDDPEPRRLKPGADPAADPKGLIFEAYRIDGITGPECRTIFFDWALAFEGSEQIEAIRRLLALHGAAAPDHPMTATLRAGLDAAPPARRRGGRASRVTSGEG